MKHFFTLLCATVLILAANAQPPVKEKEKEKEESCLEAYQKAFLERGAFPVEDGTYKNVIISVVSYKGETECFSGKVKVEQTYVTAIYMAYEDNTYEYLDRKYKGDNKSRINNGITEPLIADNGDKIYIIFTEKIKPKKKQFKKVNGPDKNF